MLRWVLLSLLVLTTVACSGSPVVPAPTQAIITVTLTPNPITAAVCSPDPCRTTDGRPFAFQVRGAMSIQETGGVGANIDSISETAFNPPLVYDADVIVLRSGTNRILARGTLIFPLVIVFGPNRQTVMPFTVQLTDDRGNKLSAFAQWATN